MSYDVKRTKVTMVSHVIWRKKDEGRYGFARRMTFLAIWESAMIIVFFNSTMSSPIPWVLHPLPLVQGEPVRMARDTQLPLASCNEWMNQRLEKKTENSQTTASWLSENSWTTASWQVENSQTFYRLKDISETTRTSQKGHIQSYVMNAWDGHPS